MRKKLICTNSKELCRTVGFSLNMHCTVAILHCMKISKAIMWPHCMEPSKSNDCMTPLLKIVQTARH